jgi:Uma2 family endonuclease
MTTSARALVSEQEFLSMPESMRPAELIDGEVILAPSPSIWHQGVLMRLVFALQTWAATRSSPITIMQAPLDIRFAPGRILQPDAMVFLTTLSLDVAMPLERVPDLCIEVLSNNRVYDRVTKRLIYAEAGVAEYWLVDPAGVIEKRTGQGLGRVQECEDRLTSELLPGFELDVAGLLRPR